MSQSILNKEPHLSIVLAEDDLSSWVQNFIRTESFQTLGLIGPMGAGKTTLVRHLAQVLGAADDEVVSSPTFSILQQYQTPNAVINHFDLYRLSSFEEFEELDFIDIMQSSNHINVVEWADRFEEIVNLSDVIIKLDYVEDTNQRSLQVWKK